MSREGAEPMRDSIFPITLVAAGVIWLLFNLDWIPSFDWVVTIILIASGIGILLLEGITKKSIVGGPLLIAIGLTWLLHFYAGVRWRFLAPGLCIIAGLLMLLARADSIPEVRAGRALSDNSNPE
jgi:hypothetical protein